MDHNVFFILERKFGGDLWSLSRAGHVWLIRSAENDIAAKAV